MKTFSFVCTKAFKPGFGCKYIEQGEVIVVELLNAEFQIVKASQYLPFGLSLKLNDLGRFFQGVN